MVGINVIACWQMGEVNWYLKINQINISSTYPYGMQFVTLQAS